MMVDVLEVTVPDGARYSIYHRPMDRGWWGGYLPGQELRHVVDGFVRSSREETFHFWLETIFRIHNQGTTRHRSLSTGDVVRFGEVAFSCEPAGWKVVSLDPADHGRLTTAWQGVEALPCAAHHTNGWSAEGSDRGPRRREER